MAAANPHYKWIVLSNTTLGGLIATINASILLIALPDIFRGLAIDPLSPGNTSLLLWLIMGYLVVPAVLVVSFGRLGDMFGRVRMYNAGFAVFTVFSILLSVTWMHGTAGALWLILIRVLQGVGGAMLMANSAAIITDSFPVERRGLALGLNQVTAIAGTFVGLVLGGVLAPVQWRLVFLVSVPIGVFGTVWAYLKLHDTGITQRARLDWWGNAAFAIGLIAVLVGITYGIQPYRGHTMGWTNPAVLAAIVGGLGVLVLFCVIETRVTNRCSSSGCSGSGRSPRASREPARGARAGWPDVHSDHLVAGHLVAQTGIQLRIHATVGRHLYGAAYRRFPGGGPHLGMVKRPIWGATIRHWRHGDRGGHLRWAEGDAGELHVPGVRGGPGDKRARYGLVCCAEPGGDHEQRATEPAGRRGRNERNLPEFGHGTVDRHLLQPDHHRALPLVARRIVQRADHPGCSTRSGDPVGGAATGLRAVRLPAGLQPDSIPMGPTTLAQLAPGHAEYLTGRAFFPEPISGPFSQGLTVAFGFAIAACLTVAVASWLRGSTYSHPESAPRATLHPLPPAAAAADDRRRGSEGHGRPGSGGPSPDSGDRARIQSVITPVPGETPVSGPVFSYQVGDVEAYGPAGFGLPVALAGATPRRLQFGRLGPLGRYSTTYRPATEGSEFGWCRGRCSRRTAPACLLAGAAGRSRYVLQSPFHRAISRCWSAVTRCRMLRSDRLPGRRERR